MWYWIGAEREGFPLVYELIAGNRTDLTTVEQIIELMEGRYGRASRSWVMDRGMVREEITGLLTKEGRRYILGTQRGRMKRCDKELLKGDWQEVHAGLAVKRVVSPDGKEVFILCRSRDRAEKERAIHDRF